MPERLSSLGVPTNKSSRCGDLPRGAVYLGWVYLVVQLTDSCLKELNHWVHQQRTHRCSRGEKVSPEHMHVNHEIRWKESPSIEGRKACGLPFRMTSAARPLTRGAALNRIQRASAVPKV